jgi:murein L,D-transpeptidase YafK
MKQAYSLKISVQEKKLLLLDPAARVLRGYDIIAGRSSSEGHKCREGDQRTPRGLYYICTINDRSDFTIFYGISYPGPQDGLEGLHQGLITRDEFEEIQKAAEQEKRPPWNTALGGEVGIHGGGIDRDGTRGCIGMRDEDALALRDYVFNGMQVWIE